MKNQYTKNVVSAINEINKDSKFIKAGDIIAQAYIDKKRVYTFGTGHSHMLGEELYARAGGWSFIKPMLLDEITLSSHPYKSTLIERVEGFADVMLGLFPLNKDDVIIITSNSGRNPLIVEMALRAKEIGASVIAVTSLKHSNSITSRHKSGKLLKDVADLVIDNKAPSGDATIKVGSSMIAPISTITDIFIAHQLVIQALSVLEAKGIDFDVYVSSNLDNQDERNKKIMEGK